MNKGTPETTKTFITASQESLLQLRQDFHSESEEEESKYESEDHIFDLVSLLSNKASS
jgi:hypothetical protein